jgi:hypothetical protein
MNENYWPEPIWALHFTKEQIERGDWITIEPSEIKDYRINPFEDGWEARYADSAIEKLKALGLPRHS